MDDFLQLFERARSGDSEARGELMQRHLGGLRAFVRLKSGELIRAKESESDLVQSACREALSDLSSFECKSEEHFRGWLKNSTDIRGPLVEFGKKPVLTEEILTSRPTRPLQ